MNTKPLVIVVEDELLIAEHLVSILSKLGYDVLSFFFEDSDFVSLLRERKPFLVFLDIRLEQETTGVDLAKICQEYSIPFIYLTSYSDKKTVKNALQYEPISFMLKPFTAKDIEVNVELAKVKLKKLKDQSCLVLKDGYDTVKIDFFDIKWLKSDDNYTEIVTSNRRVIQRLTLKALHDMLPQNQFVRVHRSFVVNINFVSKVSYDFLLIGMEKIPISRKKKSEVLASLEQN